MPTKVSVDAQKLAKDTTIQISIVVSEISILISQISIVVSEISIVVSEISIVISEISIVISEISIVVSEISILVPVSYCYVSIDRKLIANVLRVEKIYITSMYTI